MRLERIVPAFLALAVALPAGAQSLLAPAALDHDHYGESWTFIADLDDGSYAQLQLSVTNLGPGSGHGICRALFVPAKGSAWNADDRVGQSGWRHNASDSGEMLRVGPCSVRNGGGRLLFRAQLDGRTLELQLPEARKPEHPPSHVLEVGGGRHTTELVLTSGAAQLRMRDKSGTTTTLEGGGYADHSISTVEPKALARSWVRFRAVRGSERLLLLGREDHGGAFAPLWLRKGQGGYDAFARFALERSGDKGKPAFVVSVAGEGNRSLRIRSAKLLYRHAPVEALGILSTVVKPFAGSPVTYTYRAELEMPGGARVQGILEVQLDEE